MLSCQPINAPKGKVLAKQQNLSQVYSAIADLLLSESALTVNVDTFFIFLYIDFILFAIIHSPFINKPACL